MKNFKKKKRFYHWFGIGSVVWSVLPAIFVAIAYVLDPMYWILYNFIWENVSLFICQYCLILMYNPMCNMFNVNYAFHHDNLPYLTNIPWKADPNINKDYLNSSRASKNAGPISGSNKFNFLGGDPSSIKDALSRLFQKKLNTSVKATLEA